MISMLLQLDTALTKSLTCDILDNYKEKYYGKSEDIKTIYWRGRNR